MWTLSKIVDGDTLYAIDSTGNSTKFRLIGIDTPESRHPRKPVQPYSAEATAALTSYLANDTLYIEYDIQTVDRYNRALAYVYDADKELVNAKLVAGGFARVSTYPPNVKYVELFTRLQQEARSNNIGLWGLAIE